ncbi:MAG TPA: right-handed parallel beta-helix repeat-containing protein [bacterium]
MRCMSRDVARRAIRLGLAGAFLFRLEVKSSEYFVAPSGNDSNTGTIQSPWKTISKANHTLKAGDVCTIRQGSYAEDINPVNSGSESSPIVYRNYGSETAVLTGPTSGEEVAVVALGYFGSATGWGATSYIHIEGLTIQPSYARYGIVVYGSRTLHNQIRNCRLICAVGGKRDAILIGSAKYTLVENNLIDGNWRLGIITTQTPVYTIVRGNTIQNMVNSGIDIQTSYGENQAFLIENNTISGSQIEDGIQFEPDYSRYDPGTRRGVIIRNNVICNNAENAIDLKGAAFVVIDGNTMYGNRGDNDGSGNISGGIGGVFKGDITFTQAHDILVRRNLIYDNFGGIYITYYGWTVVHNTILANNRTYWGSEVSKSDILNAANDDARRSPKLCGVIIAEATVNHMRYCAIKNNIIGLNHQGEINLINSKDLTGTDINNNLYYNDIAVSFVDLTANWNWRDINFDAFKARMATIPGLLGRDAQSLVVSNPGLKMGLSAPVGAGPFNFALESNSPAIDQGGFLTQTVGAGSGKTLTVKNARYFSDGFGITDGDVIKIASNGQTATIVSVTDSTQIVLDRDVTWTDGDGVSLFYYGNAPDIGASEYIPQYFPHEGSTETFVYLSADVMAKTVVQYGKKMLQVEMTASDTVVQVPTPIILQESDGTQTEIALSGQIPGKVFSGSVAIDNTIAEGQAKLVLKANSLINADQVTGSDIVNGGNVYIDKTPPAVPMSVKILIVSKT